MLFRWEAGTGVVKTNSLLTQGRSCHGARLRQENWFLRVFFLVLFWFRSPVEGWFVVNIFCLRGVGFIFIFWWWRARNKFFVVVVSGDVSHMLHKMVVVCGGGGCLIGGDWFLWFRFKQGRKKKKERRNNLLKSDKQCWLHERGRFFARVKMLFFLVVKGISFIVTT